MTNPDAGGEDRSHVLTFLYKIIDDNQATIRFLDTKAGFGIALLGAVIGKCLLDPDQLSSFVLGGYAPLIVFIFFALLALIAAALGFRTVFPTVNPANNVELPSGQEPAFFITEFSTKSVRRYFLSGKKFAQLKLSHAKYCQSLRAASPQAVESALAGEVLKLSFIRQLKTDRLSAFATFLALAVILFVALIFVAPKRQQLIPPQALTPAAPVRVLCDCSTTQIPVKNSSAPAHKRASK